MICPSSGISAPERHLIIVDLPASVIANYCENFARKELKVSAI